MYPVDAIIRRLNLREEADEEHLKCGYQWFWDPIQNDVFGIGSRENNMRKLILRLIHIHNNFQPLENQIQLLGPMDSDVEFLTAIKEFDDDVNKSLEVNTAVTEVQKKFDHAIQEQRAETEIALLAAVQLCKAEHILYRAKWGILERDLRHDENLFPNLIKARIASVSQTILELREKIRKSLTDVEVPQPTNDLEEGSESPDIQEKLWEIGSNEDAQFSLDERAEDHPRSLVEFMKMAGELKQSDISGALSECRGYTSRPWGLKEQWRRYYTNTMSDTEHLTRSLRDYAGEIEDRAWDFDQRVLEALEVIVEQGKGKADIEVDEDESLAWSNLDNWGDQGRISVLIRGHSQLMKEKERQPEREVLQIAQIIIDRANEKYEDKSITRNLSMTIKAMEIYPTRIRSPTALKDVSSLLISFHRTSLKLRIAMKIFTRLTRTRRLRLRLRARVKFSQLRVMQLCRRMRVKKFVIKR